MKTGCGILAVCLLTVLSAGAETKYHIFTDDQGRSIEAKIVRYDEVQNKVTVQPKGRAAMTVPVSAFSEADQAYIVEWGLSHAFLDERKLCVDIKRIKKSDGTRGQGGYSMEYKYYNHYFTIGLENKSTVDLDNVTIEYVIFYQQEKHINGNRDKVNQEGTLYKKSTFSLPSKSDKEIETDQICLKRYRESGFVNSVWPDLDGEMDGIILKLSMTTKDGETITRQITYPDNLKKAWTTKTMNVQGG